MRLAVFFVVNFLAALVFGLYAYSQGYGAWSTAIIVVAVLIIVQLVYVIWLVVLATLPRREANPAEPAAKDNVLPRSSRNALTSTPNGSGNQLR